MAIKPRLIVTGIGADDAETLISDDMATPVTIRALPGQDLYLLWGTEDGGASVGARGQQPVTLPFFAGAGGTRLLLVRFPPESAVGAPDGDQDEIAAEAARVLPGLMEAFPASDARMHRTDTLDYGICLEGELWLELEGGKEVRLTPGACVVQQGTRHAWRNHGDVHALMCFVGIGATRMPDSSGGA